MAEGDQITTGSLSDVLTALTTHLVTERKIPDGAVSREHFGVDRHSSPSLTSNSGPISQSFKREDAVSQAISATTWTDVLTATYSADEAVLRQGSSLEIFARFRCGIGTFDSVPPNNLPDGVKYRVEINGTVDGSGAVVAYLPSASGYVQGLTVIEYVQAGAETVYPEEKDNVVTVIDRILVHATDGDTLFSPHQGEVEITSVKLQAAMESANHDVVLHRPMLGCIFSR